MDSLGREQGARKKLEAKVAERRVFPGVQGRGPHPKSPGTEQDDPVPCWGLVFTESDHRLERGGSRETLKACQETSQDFPLTASQRIAGEGGPLGTWKALSLETFLERKEHFPCLGLSPHRVELWSLRSLGCF